MESQDGNDKKRFSMDDRFFGSVTVGERGQVVIPADARKEFHIEPGDKLLIMSTPDKTALVLCGIDNFREFVNAFQENLTRAEQHLATGSNGSPAPSHADQSAGSASHMPLTEEEENQK